MIATRSATAVSITTQRLVSFTCVLGIMTRWWVGSPALTPQKTALTGTVIAIITSVRALMEERRPEKETRLANSLLIGRYEPPVKRRIFAVFTAFCS